MKEPEDMGHFISQMAAKVMVDVEQFDAPFRALNEKMQSQMSPPIAIAEALQREKRKLGGFHETLRKNVDPMLEIFEQIDAPARRLHESIKKAIRDTDIDFRAIVRAMEEDKARFPEEMQILAEHGWYVQPQMTPRQHREICSALVAGWTEEVERVLVKHFNAELNKIEDKLCRHTPKRERIFKSAFAAHRRGDFASSIPLMLAQADGICRDYTGGHLFTGRHTLQAWVNAGKPSMLMYFAALVEVTPIIASEKERLVKPVGFSRHAIMHGESTDYDTAGNGARAVSLLVYIDWVLGELSRMDKAKLAPQDELKGQT